MPCCKITSVCYALFSNTSTMRYCDVIILRKVAPKTARFSFGKLIFDSLIATL